VFQTYIMSVLTKFIMQFNRSSSTQSGDRAKVEFFNSLKIRAVFDFLMQ
jgi:hypothetical protein